MPISEVRAAVASYLDPATSDITYLSKVYQALPKVANEADLFLFIPPGAGIGATIYMFIKGNNERRKSFGGAHSGRKRRDYDLKLLCIFKSDLPEPYDGQVAFHTFIDSLTGWIQADRTAGTGLDSTGQYAGTGYVFSWGEGTGPDTPDIDFDYTVPTTHSGGVTVFRAVGQIDVAEYLDT